MPPKGRRPIIPEICPDCGEKDTIVMDEYLGEIHCTECGIVLRGGLEENAESAFHDDQVKNRNQQQDLHVGGSNNGNTNNKSNQVNRMEKYTNDVIQHIASLRTQLDAPESVSIEAKALLPDFLAVVTDGGDSSSSSQQQNLPNAPLLAVALFHIASYVQHYPVSLSQAARKIHQSMPNLSPARDLVGAIIDALKIQLPTPEKTLSDLVTVLLDKLQFRIREPMTTMASTMAATFDSAISSRYEPRVVAAVAVFLCCWSKSCREKISPRVCAFLNSGKPTETEDDRRNLAQVQPEVKWSDEQKENLEKKLTLFIGDEDDLMRKCISYLSSDKTLVPKWVKATAEKFPEVEGSNNNNIKTKESGSRRQRE